MKVPENKNRVLTTFISKKFQLSRIFDVIVVQIFLSYKWLIYIKWKSFSVLLKIHNHNSVCRQNIEQNYFGIHIPDIFENDFARNTAAIAKRSMRINTRAC